MALVEGWHVVSAEEPKTLKLESPEFVPISQDKLLRELSYLQPGDALHVVFNSSELNKRFKTLVQDRRDANGIPGQLYYQIRGDQIRITCNC